MNFLIPDKEKLTDAEIIKALKELLEMMLHEGELQRSSTISNTLDFINRQQAEIEFLRASKGLNKAEFNELKAELELKNAEIERLRRTHKALKELAKRIKKEASICCKGLFEYNPMTHYSSKGEITTEYHITEDKLEAIVKEMVGE